MCQSDRKYISNKVLSTFWNIDKKLAEKKKKLFSGIHGQVLEIGANDSDTTNMQIIQSVARGDKPLTYSAIEILPQDATQTSDSSKAKTLPQMVEKARELNVELKYAMRCNVSNIPLPSHSFDAIICTHSLCGISSLDAVLKEVSRLLKYGGRFYFLEHVVEKKRNRVHRLLQTVLLIPLGNTLIYDKCHKNNGLIRLSIHWHPDFSVMKMDSFTLRKTPHISGYAVKKRPASMRLDASNTHHLNHYKAIAQ